MSDSFDQAIDELNDQGFTLVSGVADAPTLASARAELTRLLATTPYGRSEFEGAKTKRVYALFAKTRSLDVLATQPLVTQILKELLGHFYLSGPAAISIEPGAAAQPLHRDDGVFPIPRPRRELMASVMWPLTSFNQKNGGTVLLPGSHSWLDGAPDPSSERCVLNVEPGQAIIYRGSLWHGGGANNSDTPRLGVVLNYSVSWLRQVENHTLAVPPAVAATLPEAIQELLGYGLSPPAIGYVDGVHPRKVFRQL